MSWEIEVDTSNYRPRHQTTSMFRMETEQPFDARLLNLRMQPAAQSRARVAPSVFGVAGGTSRLDDSMYGGTDDEKRGLLRGSSRREGTMLDRMTICALALILCGLMFFMGYMYWSFTSSVSQARDLSRPYLMEAVNHTLSLLNNLDHGARDAHYVVDDVHSLTGSAVPALQHALNQSAMIVDRLERLARNPVLQLSLNTAGGGVGG